MFVDRSLVLGCDVAHVEGDGAQADGDGSWHRTALDMGEVLGT